MRITYIIPIQSDSISFLFDQMELEKVKYILYFPKDMFVNEKEKIFQKLHSLILQNSSFYFFYQYPKSLSEKEWIQYLTDFTDYDDKILYIKNWKEEKCDIYKKENHLEYQKMNYQKLRILFQKDELWMNTIFYHQDYPSPYHILSIKKKLIRQPLLPKYTLLSRFLESESIQPFEELYPLDVYVIHIPSRKDREEQITYHLQKHQISFQFFNALNIPDSIVSLNRFHFAKSSYQYVKGAIGCKDSHKRLISSYYEKEENQERYLLVLEDDFHFYPYQNIIDIIKNHIKELEKQTQNWTILYLTLNLQNRFRSVNSPCGTTKRTCQASSVSSPCGTTKRTCQASSVSTQEFEQKRVKEGEGLSTAGYVVNYKRYERVLEVIRDTKEEIDVGYAKYLEDRFYTEPYMGYQYESYSDIQSEIVHYDFMY